MLLGSDNIESSERILLYSGSSLDLYDSCEGSNSFIDLDICPTTCHIGRDRDGSIVTSSTDDISFTSVLFGIEYFVWDSFFFEEIREIFTLCD